LALGLLLGRPAEHAHLAHLLDPDRQAEVALAGHDRQPGHAHRGGTGGAGVVHVVGRYAGLADLLLQALGVVRVGLVHVADGQDAHVLDGGAGVGQGAQGDLAGQVQLVPVREPAELGHRGTDDPHVPAAHAAASLCLKPKPMASVPSSSVPIRKVSSSTSRFAATSAGSMVLSRFAFTEPPPSRSTTTEVNGVLAPRWITV